MSFCSSVSSFCSKTSRYACDGIGYIGKSISTLDDKTFKVSSSIKHMWKSVEAKNYTELLFGGVSSIRGVANAVVFGAYMHVLKEGASVSDIVDGEVSLHPSVVAFAAAGLFANAMLESASASKSWVLKTEDIDQNSLAIQRIMNKGFLEKIKRLALSQSDERYIQTIFNRQVATSVVFTLGFVSLAALSIGGFINPLGVLAAVTSVTALKAIRYAAFSKFLKDSLKESHSARCVTAYEFPPEGNHPSEQSCMSLGGVAGSMEVQSQDPIQFNRISSRPSALVNVSDLSNIVAAVANFRPKSVQSGAEEASSPDNGDIQEEPASPGSWVISLDSDPQEEPAFPDSPEVSLSSDPQAPASPAPWEVSLGSDSQAPASTAFPEVLLGSDPQTPASPVSWEASLGSDSEEPGLPDSPEVSLGSDLEEPASPAPVSLSAIAKAYAEEDSIPSK